MSPGPMDWNTVLLIKNILCDEVIELKTIHYRIIHEHFYLKNARTLLES